MNPFETSEDSVEDANTNNECGELKNTEIKESVVDTDTADNGIVVASPESPNTPVLRRVGEKTSPNTLKRDRSQSSCKSWYSQYSQGFLSKTIDTPDIELPPLGDEDDEDVESSDTVESGDTSPNYERKIK